MEIIDTFGVKVHQTVLGNRIYNVVVEKFLLPSRAK